MFYFTDGSSFLWGLGIGIMYMMSSGKAEIHKLNTSMDETAKVVQELKTELYKRKSLRDLQASSFSREADTSRKKIGGKRSGRSLAKSSTRNQDLNVVNISSLPVIDDGEYASSVLTEEPWSEVLEIDQLEAELKSELQKLPCCTTDAPGCGEIGPVMGEVCLVA